MQSGDSRAATVDETLENAADMLCVLPQRLGKALVRCRRRLDGSGLLWARRLADRLRARAQALVGKLRYESWCGALHESIDFDGNCAKTCAPPAARCIEFLRSRKVRFLLLA